MVLTRSMTARLQTQNRYDPNNRIRLVTPENLRNKTLTLADMFDIYNDIKYKAGKNGGKIEDNDLRPLLYAFLGIFRNQIANTILNMDSALSKMTNTKSQFLMLNLLSEIKHIDGCIRQFGVNCGFGDLDKSNSELEIFSSEQINSIFARILTPYDIRSMGLFEVIQIDYDNFIDKLNNFISNHPEFTTYFLTELCANNFMPDSVYGYLDWCVQSIK
jgi:hypothetical protein